MSALEYKKTLRLLREKSRATKYEDIISSKLTPAAEKRLRKRRDIDLKLEQISEAVLLRELGLKKFMVVHFVRDDGYETKLQVKQFSISEGYGPSNQIAWRLEGRNLLKDGSFGSKEGTAYIFIGTISRRKLDGEWQSLEPMDPLMLAL